MSTERLECKGVRDRVAAPAQWRPRPDAKWEAGDELDEPTLDVGSSTTSSGKPVDLRVTVAEALELLEPTLVRSNIRWVFAGPRQPVMLSIRAGLLRHGIVNLVLCAIDTETIERLAVQIRSSGRGACVRISCIKRASSESSARRDDFQVTRSPATSRLRRAMAELDLEASGGVLRAVDTSRRYELEVELQDLGMTSERQR